MMISFIYIFACRKLSSGFIFNRPSMIWKTHFHSNLNSDVPDVTIPSLTTSFDRWKFLQQTLEGETSYSEVYPIIYSFVYIAYNQTQVEYKARMTTIASSNNTFHDEPLSSYHPTLMTDSSQEQKLFKVLEYIQNKITSSSASFFQQDTHDKEQLLQLLEALQPDPLEEEDAYKSCWDLVKELYGQEVTKYAEKSGDLEWKVRCSIVRLLIHYDFFEITRRT